MHSRKFVDLTGQRFGRLVVEGRDHTRAKWVYWICRCDCGKKKSVIGASLKSGGTRSCGCLHDENSKNTKWKTHGESGTRLYRKWQSMKARCYQPNSTKYKNYGGRGITVCDQWRSDYAAFRDWALANGYEDGLTIDRIDVNGNYEPSNCRWTTQKKQQNNRSNNRMLTYNGETKSLTEWAEDTGISEMVLRARITKLGWSVERALTEPVKNTN